MEKIHKVEEKVKKADPPAEKGLTSSEAKSRLSQYGENKLERTKKQSTFKLFIDQFTSPLTIILIVAAAILVAIGFIPGQKADLIDPILIGAIVILSGVVGFFQEYKSERTIEALQKMATPSCWVIRDGGERRIPSTEIVPGDLILLDEGDVVPADAKVVSTDLISLNEAPLTGESNSVNKKVKDPVFMNTYVVAGGAKALVMHTGMKTRVGEIAGKLQQIKEEKTPFEDDIREFSKRVFWIIVGIALLIGVIGLFKYSLMTSILTAISLAVAAIPEGLPAVITLTLAIGAKTMSSRKALIRKLSVTESVGSIDIICTDKTGTITRNEMKVKKVYANDQYYNAEEIFKKEASKMKDLFLIGALCNKAHIVEKDGKRVEVGDPTEIAIKEISNKQGFEKNELEKTYKKVHEIPFSSTRKMMSVIYDIDGKRVMLSKGAPEVLMKVCSKIKINGKVSALTSKAKEEILGRNREMASKGLRVLGFAYKETKNTDSKYEEKELIWVGLQAMVDPPRKEVKEAIKKCSTAGIRVIMLTGDNPLTAKAIADEIGLKGKAPMTGDDIDALNDEKLKAKLYDGFNIFARVSPMHKLRVLNILQKEFRVAMTGDGVNDALALKKADVGISMGIRGTEVAKQASDIILLDDNFATIIPAVQEGRRIFDNIRKFINYLFVTNLAEVLVVFLSTIILTLNEPIILPVQLLWINLLTDGIPAIALGVDPPRPGVLERPPRKKNEPLINRRLKWIIGVIGVKKMIILFATFFILLPLGVGVARTALFTGFVLYEFVRVGTIRSYEKLTWFSNKFLLFSLIISVILQIALIYSPLGAYFDIVKLGWYPWLIIISGIVIGYVLAIWLTGIIVKHVKE